jgi:hypothetical protein
MTKKLEGKVAVVTGGTDLKIEKLRGRLPK